MLEYTDTKQHRYVWIITLVYALSSFMLELFYLTPAFVFIVLSALDTGGAISAKVFKGALLKIVLPQVLIFLFHLFLFHLIYGRWIAHYSMDLGAAFTPSNVIIQLSKYAVHVLTIERFLPNGIRMSLYHFIEHRVVWFIIGSGIVACLLFGLKGYKKTNEKRKAIFVLFLFSLLSCVLIIQMWYDDVMMMMTDRYYYLPGIFFFLLASSILFYSGGFKKLQYAIGGLFLIACIWGAEKMVFKFRAAGKVQSGTVKNFKWQNADTVLLLNLPNNFDGIFIAPTNPDSTECLNSHYNVFMGHHLKPKIYDVSSYNIQNRWDGVHVVVLDSLSLKVTLNNAGSWWWFGTLGASDYENELYRLEFIENGFSYQLHFKHPPAPGIVILYQVGEAWKRVDTGKWNQEQW